MAAQYSFSTEGHSVTRPPMLDNVPFDYWKNRMSRFLRSQDPRLWNMLTTPYNTPMKTVNDKLVEKSFDEWTAREIELDRINSICMNCLYCALKPDDYMKVSTLQTAKDIWDKLLITYEGTNEVRNANINRLVHEFELFRMLPFESITDMHSRFMMIVNQLHSLGRIYNNEDLVHKLLRCLPVEWDPKVTAICESKDFTKYSIDHLLGSLLAHEQGLKARELEGSSSKKKEERRVIALQIHDNDTSSSGSEEEGNEDIALMTRQFRALLRRKQQRYGKSHIHKFRTNKSSTGDREGPLCYNCQKFGHVKRECPDLEEKTSKESNVKKKKKKKKKDKRKALWAHSDSETCSSSSSEEEINLALMARGGEENESDTNEVNDCDVSYDELDNAFNDLFKEYKKLGKKYKFLQNMHVNLKNHFNDLKADYDVLKGKSSTCDHATTLLKLERENILLKAKLELLSKSFSRKNTSTIARRYHVRNSHSYSSNSHTFPHDHAYRRSYANTNVWCNHCGKHGHLSYDCYSRKNQNQTDFIWLPKLPCDSYDKSLFNVGFDAFGPNMVWVPKLK